MKNQDIHIVPYDPQWIAKFEKEKLLLEKTLGAWVSDGIHHVGSTSIPGVDAKPIVDILIGIHNLEDAQECIPLLEQIGYCHYPYRSDVMIWFCKPSPEEREFHLQLMQPSEPLWQERFLFRDYLKSHPHAAKEYMDLKKSLAEDFRQDREGYTDAKTHFVQTILKKAQDEVRS